MLSLWLYRASLQAAHGAREGGLLLPGLRTAEAAARAALPVETFCLRGCPPPSYARHVPKRAEDCTACDEEIPPGATRYVGFGRADLASVLGGVSAADRVERLPDGRLRMVICGKCAALVPGVGRFAMEIRRTNDRVAASVAVGVATVTLTVETAEPCVAPEGITPRCTHDGWLEIAIDGGRIFQAPAHVSHIIDHEEPSFPPGPHDLAAAAERLRVDATTLNDVVSKLYHEVERGLGQLA